jgi:hypothetical protein
MYLILILHALSSSSVGIVYDPLFSVYMCYDTYVAEFHKKRKMYTSSVADK